MEVFLEHGLIVYKKTSNVKKINDLVLPRAIQIPSYTWSFKYSSHLLALIRLVFVIIPIFGDDRWLVYRGSGAARAWLCAGRAGKCVIQPRLFDAAAFLVFIPTAEQYPSLAFVVVRRSV